MIFTVRQFLYLILINIHAQAHANKQGYQVLKGNNPYFHPHTTDLLNLNNHSASQLMKATMASPPIRH